MMGSSLLIVGAALVLGAGADAASDQWNAVDRGPADTDPAPISEMAAGSVGWSGASPYVGDAPGTHQADVHGEIPVGPKRLPVSEPVVPTSPSAGPAPDADTLFPYDAPEPWLHGYFQEIPAYHGFHFFRPYNYKHVTAHSRWMGERGFSPVRPYSQDFWPRYHDRAVSPPPPLPRRPFHREPRSPVETPSPSPRTDHR